MKATITYNLNDKVEKIRHDAVIRVDRLGELLDDILLYLTSKSVEHAGNPILVKEFETAYDHFIDRIDRFDLLDFVCRTWEKEDDEEEPEKVEIIYVADKE